MKRTYLLILLGAIIMFSSTQEANAGWWNVSYTYNQAINVTNTTNLTDFQVNVILNSSLVGAHFNWTTFGNNTRFTTNVSGTEYSIPFQIEYWNNASGSGNASIWVKTNITTLPNPQINMYYGNPSATNASDISVCHGGIVTSRCFDILDNLTDNIKTNWTEPRGGLPRYFERNNKLEFNKNDTIQPIFPVYITGNMSNTAKVMINFSGGTMASSGNMRVMSFAFWSNSSTYFVTGGAPNGNTSAWTFVNTTYTYSESMPTYPIANASYSVYYNGTNIVMLRNNVQAYTAAVALSPYEYFGFGNFYSGAPAEAKSWAKNFNVTKWSPTPIVVTGIGTEQTNADTTPPTITVSSPVNNTNYSTASIWFNASVYDATGISTVLYSLDGSANVSLTNSSGNWNNNNATMAQGLHSVIFFVNDTLNNKNQSGNYTFRVDTLAPASFAFVSPTLSNNTYSQYNWYYVNLTFVELNTDTCRMVENGANITMTKITNNCYMNMTGQSDGLKIYNVSVNDTAGNTGVSGNMQVTVDTTLPSINFTGQTDANASTVNRNWTFINVSTSDANNITSLIDFNRNLVGWYRFNQESGENTTFFKDWSSYGNNGTCLGTNCSNYINGKFGTGVQFDGSDDYIDAQNDTSFQIADKLTLDMWIKPQPNQEYCYDGVHGNNGIVGIVDKAIGTATWSWQLRYGSPEACSLGLQLNTVGGGYWVNVGYNLSTTEWSHIVTTFNGTNEKLYLNGNLINETTFASTTIITDPKNKLLLGVAGWGESNTYYNGSLDEFRIYNRELSPEEINASYNAGVYRLYHNFTNLADGTYTYTAYAQDLAGNVNQTETRTLTINASGADPCACPAINTNWAISLSDYCIISADCNIGTGNITFTNTGNVTFNATITAKNIGILPANQRGYLGNNAKVRIG